MIRAGIVGGSGLTGRELLKILLKHPETEVVYITSRALAGKKVSSVFPLLKGNTELKFVKPIDAVLFTGIDVVFICLPHTAAMKLTAEFAAKKIKVIDLSADYRIKDPKIYEKYYKVKHPYLKLLKEAVYGLPELNRKAAAGAAIIANPGCYATSVILGLYPAIAALDFQDIIVDSKSGISGAGAEPTNKNRFINVNENVIPYNTGRKHRHLGEIEYVLKAKTGKKAEMIFTPQLVALDRGIVSVMYVKLKKAISLEKAKAIYAGFYKHEPFVRLVDSIDLHAVQNTNYCDIFIDVVKEKKTLMVISALDNMVKGASGQAVQNMNIMFNLDETTGLK